MIRYRALFEDLTGLREGREEPARDRELATENTNRPAETPR